MEKIYEMQDKKRLECEFLYSFRCLCSDFPCGIIECHREAPDVVVRSEKFNTGIEITRIYRSNGDGDASLQSVEATKQQITTLAKKYAEELGTPPANVALFFAIRRPLTANKCEVVARTVAKVVHENMPFEGNHVELRQAPGQPLNIIDLIQINRIYPSAQHEWMWPEFGDVEKGVIRSLQSAIDGKATRFPKYVQVCDACWLLVIAPSFKPSGMVRPDEASLHHVYVSPFDRTYFLHLVDAKLSLLRTRPTAEIS